MQQPSLVCFGEVLWDLLPAGKIAGGAPMNVACHAANLGLSAKMISRVGADDLGSALRAFMTEKGVSTRLVQTDPAQPTGIVRVTLDAAGTPAYDIVQPSAWDFIERHNDARDTVGESDALVFGSLACRAEQTRHTLFDLLENAPLRVFDVNLREPFFSRNLVEALLGRSDIVKMNDHELVIIAGWRGAGQSSMAAQMEALKAYFGIDTIVVTRGADGAAAFSDSGFFEQAGLRVSVQDSIGSGDAFLAGFLSRLLAAQPMPDCLRFANALGALTATKAGGTPSIRPDEIQRFLHQTA